MTEIVKSPMLMLQEQLDKGVSVQDLKSLMDMAERYQAIQAEQAWNISMTNSQRDMQPLMRNKQNTHNKKWYSTFEQLDKQIRPIYLREKFSLCFTEIPQEKPDICRMGLDILHELGHVRRFMKDVHVDGQGIRGNANMTSTQADGSTASYARRYVTKMGFNLVEEGEDFDGDVATQARVTQEEIELLEYNIRELTVLRCSAVDIAGLLRFASPDLKNFGDMNREQLTRVLSELTHQRELIHIAEKKGKK